MERAIAMGKKNPSVDYIIEHILTHDPAREYTYIIMGKPGPTGKSTLSNDLRMYGYDSYEITEDLLRMVDIRNAPCHEENSFIVNYCQQYVLIVLNRRVR